MKRTCFTAMLLVLALGLSACDRDDNARFPLEPVAGMDGFAVPECALATPETDFVYVSNIEAAPAEYWSDNGKGFISRLHPDGTVETLRWIDSQPEFVINSPKGMCILDGIEVLNNGSFLVSDFVGGKVFWISADRETATAVAELESPAAFGVDQDRGRLYVPQLKADRLSIFELP